MTCLETKLWNTAEVQVTATNNFIKLINVRRMTEIKHENMITYVGVIR